MKAGTVCRMLVPRRKARVHNLHPSMDGRVGVVVRWLDSGNPSQEITPEGWWQIWFPCLQQTREIMRAHLRYVPGPEQPIPHFILAAQRKQEVAE